MYEYIFLKFLGLINTYPALILSYATFALPFSTLMLKSFFDSIPTELEEAAMVDGCSRIGALLRVALPCIAPGLVATGIFRLMLGWNEFLFALTFANTPEMRTVTVGIWEFVHEFDFAWQYIMAGCVVMALPMVILFLFLQKYIVQGMTAGAVKG